MTEFGRWMPAVLLESFTAAGIVMVACAVFSVLERLRPAAPDPGLRGRLQNVSIFILALLGALMLSVLANLVGAYVPNTALIKRLLPGWKAKGAGYAVAATVLYALVWDFFQYWLHRAQHVIPALWKFHRVHHSDPAMNASTALRQSLGSVVLGQLAVHLPTMAVCGGDFLPVAGQYVLFSAWGYLNHANLRISFGAATGLVSGPQLHRLHHGRAPVFHDCNYAAFFPLLDFLFGTLKLPRRNEWPETGIEDALPRNAFSQVFFPWRGTP